MWCQGFGPELPHYSLTAAICDGVSLSAHKAHFALFPSLAFAHGDEDLDALRLRGDPLARVPITPRHPAPPRILPLHSGQ